MKKSLFLSLLVISTLALHAENLPFGYVKTSDIFGRNESGSAEFQERINALQVEVQKMAGDLESMQQEHESLAQELQSEKAKLLSDAAKKTKAQRIMQIEREIPQRYQELQMYANRIEFSIREDIINKVKKILESVAAEKKLKIIFAECALYVDPALDLTQEVLNRLNTEYEAGKKKKPAATKPAASGKTSK